MCVCLCVCVCAFIRSPSSLAQVSTLVLGLSARGVNPHQSSRIQAERGAGRWSGLCGSLLHPHLRKHDVRGLCRDSENVHAPGSQLPLPCYPFKATLLDTSPAQSRAQGVSKASQL